MSDSPIPQHTAGKQNDLDHTVTCSDRAAAIACYELACGYMLSPGKWHDLAGPMSAQFTLVDGLGNEVIREARASDHVKIDIPGPGTKTGEGYDWVRVELVERDEAVSGDQARCSVRLRPCANPQVATDETAHFFKDAATSTFIIHRLGNSVTASYHGRNEQPNTGTDHVMDNVRNAIVTSGAVAGLSEAQWNALIKAFVA